jgi:hypothetical protein
MRDETGIPFATREEIIERDGHVCRLCGVYVEIPHVHHVTYRSAGGDWRADNLVSLDWRCHAKVHSSKPLWTPILQAVIKTPGVNGIALLRWYEAKEGRHER